MTKQRHKNVAVYALLRHYKYMILTVIDNTYTALENNFNNCKRY